MRVAAALALCLIAAPRSVSAERSRISPAVCRERIAGLEAIFREGEERAEWVGPYVSINGLQPPFASGGEAARAVTETVDRGLTETRVEGQLVAARSDVERVAAIAARVDAQEKQRRMLHAAQLRPPPMLLGIWLDRRLPARAVLPLVEALGSKYAVGLLAREDPPKRREFPPHVAQRLEQIRSESDPTIKFRLLGDTTRAALAACRAPSTADGASEVLAAALQSCSCEGADLDMLEAVVAAGNDQPRVFLRRLRLRPRAKLTLVLEEGATVQDLVDRLPVRGDAKQDGNVVLQWKKGPTGH